MPPQMSPSPLAFGITANDIANASNISYNEDVDAQNAPWKWVWFGLGAAGVMGYWYFYMRKKR